MVDCKQSLQEKGLKTGESAHNAVSTGRNPQPFPLCTYYVILIRLADTSISTNANFALHGWARYISFPPVLYAVPPFLNPFPSWSTRSLQPSLRASSLEFRLKTKKLKR